MTTTSMTSDAVQQLLERSQALSVSERIALAQAIWDTVSLPADWKPSPEVLSELQRRRDELHSSPASAVSAEEMDKRLDAMRVS